MHKKQKIILISVIVVLLTLIISCTIFFGRADEAAIARKHLAQHSCIPDQQIKNLASRKEWQPDRKEWMFFYSFPELAVMDSTSLIEVSVSSISGNVISCSCKNLTEDDYQQNLAYYQAVLPSLTAAREWEDQFGPHQLWDADKNGTFYQAYGYIPYVSYWQYTNGAVYSVPESGMISRQEAQSIANGILADHFQGLLQEKSDLHVGSYYFGSDSSHYYTFNYYWMNEQNALEQVCYVTIDAVSGRCLHAFRNYLLEGETSLPVDSYYSDEYYFVPQEDGSFVRNDQL